MSLCYWSLAPSAVPVQGCHWSGMSGMSFGRGLSCVTGRGSSSGLLPWMGSCSEPWNKPQARVLFFHFKADPGCVVCSKMGCFCSGHTKCNIPDSADIKTYSFSLLKIISLIISLFLLGFYTATYAMGYEFHEVPSLVRQVFPTWKKCSSVFIYIFFLHFFFNRSI